jgi:hypothetical protein
MGERRSDSPPVSPIREVSIRRLKTQKAVGHIVQQLNEVVMAGAEHGYRQVDLLDRRRFTVVAEQRFMP